MIRLLHSEKVLVLKFLLQKTESVQDVCIVQDVLDQQKYLHSYEYRSLEEIALNSGDKEAMPVGNLDFVGMFLKKYYGITHMNSIEVSEKVCIERC